MVTFTERRTRCRHQKCVSTKTALARGDTNLRDYKKGRFDNRCVQVPEVKVHAEALLPSSSVIGFTLGQGLSFITFVNTVPISATRTINRFALIRRLDVDRIGQFVFNMPAWDSMAREAMIKYFSFHRRP